MEEVLLHHPTEHMAQRSLIRQEIDEIEPLLVHVLDGGTLVYDLPSIEEMRERRRADIERLDPGVKRLINPHIYHVSLTQRLWELKQALIESTLRNNDAQSADLPFS
jgi:nicotinate phosphoribosyltransferase